MHLGSRQICFMLKVQEKVPTSKYSALPIGLIIKGSGSLCRGDTILLRSKAHHDIIDAYRAWYVPYIMPASAMNAEC